MKHQEVIMKRLTLLAAALFCAGVNMEAQEAQTKTETREILVAYFSWSGNAKALAGQIAEASGGDLFEIRTAKPYPETYNECIAAAKKEQEADARPELAGSVPDIGQYDAVFLCYPNWWGTLPMGVFTFLEAYDFSDKTIYPLVTHGGSRFGRSLDDIKKLCPDAALGEGLAVSAFDTNPKDAARVSVPNRDVAAWLRKIL